MLLYFIISQWISFYTFMIFLWHAVSYSYNVMVSFAFFVFVHHTAHYFLLLVSCMLYVVKKHCPEEAHLNRWAKRRLIIKITRRTSLSAWFKTWWQLLWNNNMSSKKNKPNAIALVEKMLLISKTVGSNCCEPCPWLFIYHIYSRIGCTFLPKNWAKKLGTTYTLDIT